MNQSRTIRTQDHRKQQLIDATIRVISEHGLTNTSIAKVTKTAGLSVGIINYYFKNRDHLLASTLEHVALEYEEALETVFDSSKRPVDVLKDFVYASFRPPIFSLDKLAVWDSFCVNPRSRKTYGEIAGAVKHRIRQKIAQQVDLLVETEGFDHIHSDTISLALEQVVDYQWSSYLQNRMQFDQNKAIHTCIRLISDFFEGSSEKQDQVLPSIVEKFGLDESSWNLPNWTYHSEAFNDLEQELLFKQSWHFVGHINDIPNPGDYLTFNAFGQRAIIIRDSQQQIRAMENACKHMGSMILDQARGHCEKWMVCPFHEWVYDINGQIVKTPDNSVFNKIDKKNIRLNEFKHDIWNGFIFVSFTNREDRVSETFESIDYLFKPYHPSTYIPVGNHTCVQRELNWKVIQEVNFELQKMTMHSSHFQSLFGDSGTVQIIGNFPIWSGQFQAPIPDANWSVRHYQSAVTGISHLPDSLNRVVHHVTLQPNLTISLYPDSMKFRQTIADTAGLTRIISADYRKTEQNRHGIISNYLSRRIENILDHQQRSDIAEKLQQGIESRFSKSRLSDSSDSPTRVFHQWVWNAIPVSRLSQEPPHSKLKEINQVMLSNLPSDHGVVS